jgi:hypothetical protein
MKDAAKTPLVDLLRRVHPDATAEIAEPSGWTYHTFGLGRTMHKAASVIEKYERMVEVQKHNMIMFLAIGFILGVVIGAGGINCLYLP